MCRLTAILSSREPVLIEDIVTRPKLSIIYQSFNCHERFPRDQPRWAYEKSTLNGDGFGVGWYVGEPHRQLITEPNEPCVFRSLKPAWSDRNLKSLAAKTASNLIFAHVRAAGPGSGDSTEAKCHPFKCGRFMFMHNGTIGEWERARRALMNTIKTNVGLDFALDHTPIDSVVIFAMFIDLLERGTNAEYTANELRTKLEQVILTIARVCDEQHIEDVCYINVALTDGKTIIGSRYAIGSYSRRLACSGLDSPCTALDNCCQSLSLYFASGTRWVGGGGDYTMQQTDKRHEVCIITSEPLTEVRSEWVPVPHNHLIIVTNKCDVLLQPVKKRISPTNPASSHLALPIRRPSHQIISLQENSATTSMNGTDNENRAVRQSLQQLADHASDAVACGVLGELCCEQSRRPDTPSLRAAGSVECSGQLRANTHAVMCVQLLTRLTPFSQQALACSPKPSSNEDRYNYMISGSSNGSISIWRNGVILTSFGGHKNSVLCMKIYNQAPDLTNLLEHPASEHDLDGSLSPSGTSSCNLLLEPPEDELSLRSAPPVVATTEGELILNCWLITSSSDSSIAFWKLGELIRYVETMSLNGLSQIDNIQSELHRYLACRLTFEPMQGDILSIFVKALVCPAATISAKGHVCQRNPKSPAPPHTWRQDCLYFGTQSTVVGGIRLSSLFDRLETCACVSGTPTTWSCDGLNCSLAPFITRDWTGGPEIVFSVANQTTPPEGEAVSPTALAAATAQTMGVKVPSAPFIPGLPQHQSRGWRICSERAPSEHDYSSSSSTRRAAGGDSTPRQEACGHIEWALLDKDVMGHCSFVEAICEVGHYLVTGGGDGLIVIWRDGKPLRILSGHTGAVLCLAGDSQNSLLYSGSRDRTVRVWDLESMSCVQIFGGHRNEILAICLTDELLISASTLDQIWGWHRRWNQIVVRFTAANSCISSSVSPRHALLSLTNSVVTNVVITDLLISPDPSPQLFAACGDGGIRAWNLHSLESYTSLAKLPSRDTRKDLLDTLSDGKLNGAHALEELLKTIMCLRSISGDPMHLADCWTTAKRIGKLFEAIGASTSLVSVDAMVGPVVYGKIGADSTKPTVLLYSHYDVVSPGTEGGWLFEPWDLHTLNGCLYGRGVTDNKGPLIAQIKAIKNLIDRVVPEGAKSEKKTTAMDSPECLLEEMPANVVLVCEGGEEVGSVGFSNFVQDHLVGHMPTIDYAIFCNSYWIDDIHPCLVYGMRGLVDFTVTIRGSEDLIGLHSGIHGGVLQEPMKDLVAVIQSISGGDSRRKYAVEDELDYSIVDDKKLRHEVRIDPASLGLIERLCDESIFTINQYREATHGAFKRTGCASAVLRKRWCEPSLSVTEITSSTQGSADLRGKNFHIIPSWCKAHLSMRSVPEQSIATIVDTVQRNTEKAFADLHSTNCMDLEIIKAQDWWLSDITNPLHRVAHRAIRRVWNTEPLYICEGGSIPAIQIIQGILKVPVVQIPFGKASDNAHLPNERIGVLNLLNGVKILEDILINLPNRGATFE